MKILVIDGQGGGIGKAIIEKLVQALPQETIVALGTNALATSAMLRAGAKMGATGEHAIVVNCRDADAIAGPIGIVLSDSLLGEITPGMAAAVAASNARRYLVPSERCNTHVAGVKKQTLDEAVAEIAALIKESCANRTGGEG